MTWLEHFEGKKREELEKILSGNKEPKYLFLFNPLTTNSFFFLDFQDIGQYNTFFG